MESELILQLPRGYIVKNFIHAHVQGHSFQLLITLYLFVDWSGKWRTFTRNLVLSIEKIFTCV